MIHFRKAELRDVDDIYELGSNTHQFKVSSDVVTFWPKVILEECVDSDTVMICIAENDKKIIGFIIINLNNILRKAEIENIVIDKTYRNNKNGTMLLNFALLEINKKEFEYICALTKDAVSFFQKNGFKTGNSFTWMDFIISDKFKQ